ncbi:COQ7-domain-containing protein [Apiospora aurea]|uniref:5-demethoxyubiquinone hydroxylase, mitochondrial n=1 Tax=Apiospora aurea TaxID=335848 RepID=A0ABR1Q182_9PEZI
MLSSKSLMLSLRQSGQLPVHDFLAPALFAPSRRCISTTTPKSNASAAAPSPDGPDGPAAAAQKPKRKPLTKEQRDFLSSALRVNQAGELAATLIYTAQKPPLVNAHPHLRPLMSHMYEQEAGHLRTFNSLLAKHRVRPTALYPVWSVLASGLGWGTAVLGREAAMACTEAVETEIGTHYNSQIRSLLEMFEGWEADGYEVGPELRDLVGTLRRIRDEELEHLDHAVENDAKQAKPYWLLTSVIQAGCRGAIWASERV